MLGVRRVQDRHLIQHLAGNSKWLAAGAQDPQVRAGAQQRFGQLGASENQVLAVVQHEQDGA